MRKVGMLLALVVVIATVISCQGKTPAAGSGHIAGESVEGAYGVGYGEYLGVLNLVNGNYTFTLRDNVESPEKAVERLIFVRCPEGTYRQEYIPPVTQDTMLEDLDEDKMFFRIIFDPTETDVCLTDDSPELYRTFYLMSSRRSQELFFHSSFSEIHEWGIGKSWDE